MACKAWSILGSYRLICWTYDKTAHYSFKADSNTDGIRLQHRYNYRMGKESLPPLAVQPIKGVISWNCKDDNMAMVTLI